MGTAQTALQNALQLYLGGVDVDRLLQVNGLTVQNATSLEEATRVLGSVTSTSKDWEGLRLLLVDARRICSRHGVHGLHNDELDTGGFPCADLVRRQRAGEIAHVDRIQHGDSLNSGRSRPAPVWRQSRRRSW